MLWVNLTESAINVDSHFGIVRAPLWAQDQQQEVAEEPLEAWKPKSMDEKHLVAQRSCVIMAVMVTGQLDRGAPSGQLPHDHMKCGHVDMLWLKPPACPSPGPSSWCVFAITITCLCLEPLQDGGEVLHPFGSLWLSCAAVVVDTSVLFQPSSAATQIFWCLPLTHARLRFSLCVFW